MTVYERIRRLHAALSAKGLPVERLELSEDDERRLIAETAIYVHTGLSGEPIVGVKHVNTPYGRLDITQATTSAIVWSWGHQYPENRVALPPA